MDLCYTSSADGGTSSPSFADDKINTNINYADAKILSFVGDMNDENIFSAAEEVEVASHPSPENRRKGV